MFREFHRFFHEGSLFDGTFLNVPRVSYIFARVAGEWHSPCSSRSVTGCAFDTPQIGGEKIALLLP